ncbi:25834_t:CDS:2, partial [Gigaspora margarita]
RKPSRDGNDISTFILLQINFTYATSQPMTVARKVGQEAKTNSLHKWRIPMEATDLTDKAIEHNMALDRQAAEILEMEPISHKT